MVCEAFNCPPDVALRQDFATVQAILEYRTLQAAKEQHNRDVTQLTPGMSALWQEMLQAGELNHG